MWVRPMTWDPSNLNACRSSTTTLLDAWSIYEDAADAQKWRFRSGSNCSSVPSLEHEPMPCSLRCSKPVMLHGGLKRSSSLNMKSISKRRCADDGSSPDGSPSTCSEVTSWRCVTGDMNPEHQGWHEE